ncbi:MAG: ParB/RepB/Spo0J family partition protein, partial [Acidimicrobiales bacterium]
MRELPVDDIVPNEFQPRRRFDDDSLEALTESVRELGVLQPILVRPDGEERYELIAGERRWRAARLAGLATIPAVVRSTADQGALEQAIVENLHREDLTALEEAHAYQQLVDDFGLTQDEVASRVGKSRSAIANTLRLFQLPVVVQRMVAERRLGAGHARA